MPEPPKRSPDRAGSPEYRAGSQAATPDVAHLAGTRRMDALHLAHTASQTDSAPWSYFEYLYLLYTFIAISLPFFISAAAFNDPGPGFKR